MRRRILAIIPFLTLSCNDIKQELVDLKVCEQQHEKCHESIFDDGPLDTWGYWKKQLTCHVDYDVCAFDAPPTVLSCDEIFISCKLDAWSSSGILGYIKIQECYQGHSHCMVYYEETPRIR